MGKICARPGCNEELKTGRLYCSPKCSANRNVPIERIGYKDTLPSDLVEAISASGVDDAARILETINSVALEAAPDASNIRTHGDWILSMGGGKEYRPADKLTWDTVEMMAETGVVKFATYVKVAGILLPFSTTRTWRVTSPDKKLAEAQTAALEPIIFGMMADIVYSSIVYGVSFQETVFENKTLYDLGLSKSRSAQTTYTVPAMPKPVKPSSISHVKLKSGHFDGFVQEGRNGSKIPLDVDSSLVVTNERHFRNHWGISSYEPVYPLWFWHEVVMRSMVRYMERMGTPVTVVSAPGRKKVRRPGTNEMIDAMVWGLALAANAGTSSALVIPSDIDPETQKPYWDIKYMTSNENTQPFISVLEHLTQTILRSMIIADRAVSKDSGTTGSYAMAEIHQRANQVQTVLSLSSIFSTINRHFMPRLARYNSIGQPPPLLLNSIGLDASSMELIKMLFSVAGNSPSTQGAMAGIDYERLAADAGIPFIPENKRQDKLPEPTQKQDNPQEPVPAQDKPPEQQPVSGVPKLSGDDYSNIIDAITRGDASKLITSAEISSVVDVP